MKSYTQDSHINLNITDQLNRKFQFIQNIDIEINIFRIEIYFYYKNTYDTWTYRILLSN